MQGVESNAATQPRNRWLHPDDPMAGVTTDGPFRTLTIDGRAGVNATSLHSRLWFDAPAINAPRGTLTLWLLSLEDIDTQSSLGHINRFQPDYQVTPILTDHEQVREFKEATFAATFVNTWYPQCFVKRHRGGVYPEAYQPTKSCFVGLGHWSMRRMTWYHFAYTWDHDTSDYRVYLNGVLAATSPQYDKPLRYEQANPTLYAGHPRLVLSDIRLDDTVCSGAELRQRIEADATPINPQEQQAIERVYAGVGVPKLEWQTPDDWDTVLDLPLNTPDTLDHFYVQGVTDQATVTDEGLRVRTPFEAPPKPDDWDDQHDEPFCRHHMYLWLERFFEGDIHLSFEFLSRSDRGLGLLVAQASGMHREDFMADHPRRTSGTMRTIYGENVRNYHWEYYRHMGDTRHDVASSALLKQPWQWPLAYQCLDRTFALEQWHQLDFIHVGDRLIGAIDRIVMFDVIDNPRVTCGPVYQCGRFALRAMWKTDLTYRNLRVRLARPIRGQALINPRKRTSPHT